MHYYSTRASQCVRVCVCVCVCGHSRTDLIATGCDPNHTQRPRHAAKILHHTKVPAVLLKLVLFELCNRLGGGDCGVGAFVVGG